MKKTHHHYCTICRKLIVGSDYRTGYGFTHHRACHERVYGVQFED